MRIDMKAVLRMWERRGLPELRMVPAGFQERKEEDGKRLGVALEKADI